MTSHPITRIGCCLAIIAALGGLSACNKDTPSSTVDVHGDLPPLRLTMTRASDGAKVTANDYRGQAVALYFGYTNCPDLCPMTLGNLAQALTRLGPLASRVTVLFVTVDPARDDIAALRSYTSNFAPQIDGLRGTPDELVALTRRYRVAFTAKPKTTEGDYDVSHSSAVFVFDRMGQARMVITSTSDIGAVAGGLRKLIAPSSTASTMGLRGIGHAPG
ncbi:MAG TPA: SCO family protein [Magnetospirillaceae bacterium]|jgi:protein SCO1/2